MNYKYLKNLNSKKRLYCSINNDIVHKCSNRLIYFNSEIDEVVINVECTFRILSVG